MNTYLEARYDERLHRLAVGIEPVDAHRQSRVTPPIYVARDDRDLGEDTWNRLSLNRRDPLEAFSTFDRHDTCRHVLLYRDGLYDDEGASISLRIVEGPFRATPRRYVPRRFTIPLVNPDEADVEANPPGFRIFRPRLFPGAAYPIHETATGVRGRVERDGKPMRWARVEAHNPDSGEVVGRAHGDDRGEFLIILGSEAASIGEPTSTIDIFVTVYGPADPPEADEDELSELIADTDPLWDLPVETLPMSEETDSVSLGEELPEDYTAEDVRLIEGLRLGRITSETEPFEIE